ncbi:hypothetical protein C1I99_03485 [Micromonospora deserti]|uniref:Uncharacterized protein n=1 Tax=Micromonospora deserti TaxID=2070366 RepID=A0A2W2DA38_9ACTN|nr:hypothetical protein C1I99_03485 [Micromonospora deserti]
MRHPRGVRRPAACPAGGRRSVRADRPAGPGTATRPSRPRAGPAAALVPHPLRYVVMRKVASFRPCASVIGSSRSRYPLCRM